jgi:peroxiredoxin Q/BCP
MLAPGTPAPDFKVATVDGRLVSLADYIGTRAIVVYFYPRDDTLGCRIEACGFRDAYQEFVDAGAEVIGISIDPLSSHAAFRAKYELPFVLASDVDQRIANAYGVATRLFGVGGRATFVIDRRGIIRDAFSSSFRVRTHVSRALQVVRALRAESA